MPSQLHECVLPGGAAMLDDDLLHSSVPSPTYKSRAVLTTSKQATHLPSFLDDHDALDVYNEEENYLQHHNHQAWLSSLPLIPPPPISLVMGPLSRKGSPSFGCGQAFEPQGHQRPLPPSSATVSSRNGRGHPHSHNPLPLYSLSYVAPPSNTPPGGSSPKTVSTVPGGTICPHCGKTLGTVSGLRTHIRDKHTENSSHVQCSLCHKVYRNSHSLANHLNLYHKNRADEDLSNDALVN